MSSQIISKRILNVVSVPIAAFVMLALLLALMLTMPVAADEGLGPDSGAFPLIVGTSTNFSSSGIHDVFEVDVINNTSSSLLPLFPVWGATYDAANDRVLFTSSQGSAASVGDQLWELPTGGSLNNLGTIVDGAGAPQRMDGLAISNGTLYGSLAGGIGDGLWTIDPNTLVATLVYGFANSVSGIDADPNTGVIYGVNDSTGNLVTIDPAGSMSNVTPYPAGQTDIDGLAISDDGYAYLVTDEPGSVYVYNLNTNAYETPLTNPWGAADTFSGGAYIFAGGPPVLGIVMTKTVGLDPNTCATSTSLSIPAGGGGTVVGYCYTVMNTGEITMSTHDLVDSELGTIFPGLNYDLGPGASVDTVGAGVIVSALITQTTTNVATWTAYLDTATFTTSVASATVNVMPPTSVSLTGITGSTGTSPLAFFALLVVMAGIGALIYRKRFA